MIGTLILKDLRRLRANWVGFVILMAMPMCITGLVGTVFGPSARNEEFPKIKLALVNEDENVIGDFILATTTGERSREFLDAVAADRDEAMDRINDNQLSAVVVIPSDFTERFLSGESPPAIELIKNPAQSFMPAITEELTRVVVEILNAVSLNLSEEMPEVAKVLEGSGVPDTARIAQVITRVGDRLERAEDYVFPPIIGYDQASETEAADDAESSANGGFNIFAFVMPGVVAMFLLFVAEGSVKDVIVERRNKTLNRFRTLRPHLASYFVAKSIYAVVVVMISASIMLFGGGWIFGIHWQSPVETALLTFAYAIFCVGFAFFLIAVIYRERLIVILTTIFIMLISFFGGSMMPSGELPPIIRDHISPWMPNHVYAQTIKRLQFDMPGPDWTVSCSWLLIIGLGMLGVAVGLFQMRLRQAAEE
ncbi:MAG: ABC transporter permease [Planctomycetota bacterium]